MKFDWISFLGGLTAGAAAAVLLELAQTKKVMGQGVVGGGSFGGGGGSFSSGGGSSYVPGGTGVVVGPGTSAVSTSIGPSVLEQGPIPEGEDVGPFGDSFFGVNIAPWFWPLNIFPIYQQPQSMVCKKIKGEGDEEIFVCNRRYPVRTVAWGPPAGWL